MSSSPRQRAYATVALAFLVLLTGCGAEQGPNKQPPRLAVIVEASGSIHGRFINVE
jgi:hypothetical protein